MSHRTMSVILTLTILSVLVGCATPYGPASEDFRGGYRDFKLADNLYAVSFTGNGYTSSTDSYQMAKRRALEVCQEQGYQGFSIVKSKDFSSFSIAPVSTSCNDGNCFTSGGHSVKKPANGLVVRCTQPTDRVAFKDLDWRVITYRDSNLVKCHDDRKHKGSWTTNTYQYMYQKKGYKNCRFHTPVAGKFKGQAITVHCDGPAKISGVLFKQAAYCHAFSQKAVTCGSGKQCNLQKVLGKLKSI